MSRFVKFAEWQSENVRTQRSCRSRLGRVEALTGKDLERTSDSKLLTVLENLGKNPRFNRVNSDSKNGLRSTLRAYVRYRLSN